MARFDGRPDPPDASYIVLTCSIETDEHITGILGFEIVAAGKDRFVAYDGNSARVERERIALARCRKGRRDVASSDLRPVAELSKL